MPNPDAPAGLLTYQQLRPSHDPLELYHARGHLMLMRRYRRDPMLCLFAGRLRSSAIAFTQQQKLTSIGMVLLKYLSMYKHIGFPQIGAAFVCLMSIEPSTFVYS
jgi:hypothetical protein